MTWFLFLIRIIILAFKTIVGITCHSLFAKVTCPETHVSFYVSDWSRSIPTNDHLKRILSTWHAKKKSQSNHWKIYGTIYRICTFTFETNWSCALHETRFLHSRHRGHRPQNQDDNTRRDHHTLYNENKVKVTEITLDYVTRSGKVGQVIDINQWNNKERLGSRSSINNVEWLGYSRKRRTNKTT